MRGVNTKEVTLLPFVNPKAVAPKSFFSQGNEQACCLLLSHQLLEL